MAVLFLSKPAWDGLSHQARRAGFVRISTSNRGTVLYMRALLDVNPSVVYWNDTRPHHLKRTDLDQLETDSLPIWDDGERRYARYIGKEIPDASHIARQLGVVKAGHIRGRGDRYSMTALNSEFWEAVGLTYLSPVVIPPPKWKHPPQIKKKEFKW